MSVIQRKELITDEAIQWPEKYKKDLEEIIATSKKLGQPKNQPKVPGSDPKTRKNLDELAKVQNLLTKATEKSSKEFLGQKAALDKLNKENREAVKTINAQTSAYDKLDRELISTRKAYKDLAAAGKENTAEAKKLLAQTKKLDTQLKKIDNTVGQNQRSVGKYSDALKGVVTRLLSWAAAIALVSRGLIDAFKRIRQFDKAIVELGAILGKTRESISGLVKEIIRVASASTKTSTEVAQLATTLATLGKTESEIKNLLKPVNDLSIALKATSEEAGELLVSTLNAFGKGSSEGKRFADIIAKMRTSTALDFQRIKDALGFLAPTAKAAGISFERTGAILGVLVDNGIKAARAGRLTSTSFLRLADSGKTLEDALDEINAAQQRTTNEQEILAVSSKLFGKEAAGIGLILANNRVKTDELTDALERSKGTLQELTDAQLESFDAKLLILDSSWERFILNITNGNNFIAKDFKNSIATLTGWFDSLSDAMDGTDRKFERWKDRVKESRPGLDQLTISITALNEKIIETQKFIDEDAMSVSSRKAAQERIKSFEDQIIFFKELIQARKDEAAEAERIIKETAAKEIAAARVVAEEKKKLAKKASDERIAQIVLDQVNQEQADIDELAALDKLLQAELQAEQELQNEIAKITQKARDDKFEADKEAIKNKERLDEKAEKDRIAAIAEFRDLEVQLATETANRFTDLRLQRINQEINALEMARNRELEVEGITAEQKDAINTKFDNKKKELQRKQANAEKSNALFQIAINTAVAVTKITAEAALAAPFLIPGIIALGAIQAAAVLAAPIPQFDEGKDRTPSDYIAGEKRPELRKSKGSWSLVKEPTMFKNSPGDTIVSGKETDSILGSMADLTGKNMLTDPGLMLGLMNNDFEKKKETVDLAYIIKKSGEDTVRAINKKKFVGVTVNTSRSFITEINGQTRIEHIEQYYKS